MAENKKPQKATAKKQTAKKAAPKKAAAKKTAAKKTAAKKAPAKKAPAKKPGRPPKKVQPVQEFNADELVKSVSGVAPHTHTHVNQSEVIRANDVKSPNTRRRMLKWFKRR